MTNPTNGRAARIVAALERLAARRGATWLVLGLALALRLVGLGRGVWLDEAFTLELSVGGGAGSVLDRLRGGDNAPLYFLLSHALASIDAAPRVLRLLPVACGVGTVALVVHWARASGALAALLAGLLAATLPALLRTGGELRPYGLLVLATTVAMLAAERAGRARGPLPYLVLAAAFAAAVASHQLGALLVAPLLLLACARAPDERARPAPLALALAAGLGALALSRPWRAAAIGATAADWFMPVPTPGVVAAVLRSLVAPASPSWSEILEPSAASTAVVAASLAVAAIALAAGDRRTWLLGGAAFAWLAALLAASYLRLPVFWMRTILPAVPALVVAVAVGAATARPRLRGALALGIVVLSTAFAARWVLGEGRRPLEPWDAAVERFGPVGAADLLIVHPGYALSAVDQSSGRRLPRPVLQLGHRDPGAADRLVRRLAADRERDAGTIRLVLRIDLSTMKEGTSLPGILDAIARGRGEREVRAFALTALDVALAPALLDHRRETLALLEGRLGVPASVRDRGWLVEMRWPPAID